MITGVAAAVLAALVLAGCGNVSVSGPADDQELADRAAHIAVAPELIYAVDAETIKQAVVDAHPPNADELDELIPAESLGDREPVERGDLPSHGDGAPINPDGTGQER